MRSFRVRKSRLSVTAGDAINLMFLLLLACIMVYPFLYLVALSVSDPRLMNEQGIILFPRGFSFYSLQIMLLDDRMATGFLNSILYTVVGTGIGVLLTAMTSYPLSSDKLQSRGFFMKVIIFTMFFNGGLIPTYLLIKSLGMVNTMSALVIPGAVGAFNVILMKTFMQELPGELKESAIVDGANDVIILFRIIMPLSMPIIATITLFVSVGIWNSYFAPLIYLNDPGKYPLQLFLREIVLKFQTGVEQAKVTGALGVGNDMMTVNSKFVSQSVRASALVISTVPILCIYPFLQKYFVKGIMVGAVKG